jgi:hypothetical protein
MTFHRQALERLELWQQLTHLLISQGNHINQSCHGDGLGARKENVFFAAREE